MGRVPWSSEVFNCSAPDTGNMETHRPLRHRRRRSSSGWSRCWTARSAPASRMTEPDVASSDATNIQTPHRARRRRLRDQRPQVVVLGRRRPALQDLHRHGQDRPGRSDRHRQQSMVLVPRGHARRQRSCACCRCSAIDDAPHGHAEIVFDNVRVPVDNILLGEGRGFEIAQGRLGPGRIHHCMRAIGLAERALELMCKRAATRVAFGKPLAEQGVTHRAHRRVAHPDRPGAAADAEGRLA